MRPICLFVLASVVAACASQESAGPDRRTILTAGASEVIVKEGMASDNLICRRQRLPGSYRMIRVCQSVEEYDKEVAENRRLLDDWGSRGTACTSECGIGPEQGDGGGPRKRTALR